MKKHLVRSVAGPTAVCAATLFTLSPVHAQGAAANLPAEGELEEIVVTAQKRVENILDVPISISVLKGEDLVNSGGAQLTDFAAYIPGLQVDNSGAPGRSSTSIRGIAPIGSSATVGVYLDDAPLGASSIYARAQEYSLDLLPYDVAQIEVLRGPQGTLYGASSIGGLLKYRTIAPDLQKFSARVGGETFSLAHASDLGFAGQGFVNVPLVSDVLAMTASYAYRETPGWIDNTQTGAKDQNDYSQEGGRVSLLWQAREDFSIRLSALFQNVDTSNDAIIAQGEEGASVGNGRSNYNYFDEPYTSELQYYSATLEYDAGFATLSSTTAYSNAQTSRLLDTTRVFGVVYPFLTDPPGLIPAGLAPYLITLEHDKVSEELRLTSPSSDRFEWLLGGFYTEEDVENHQRVSALDFESNPIAAIDPAADVNFPSHYEEVAVFGNATFKFNEHFDVTAGLRWARNDQNFRQTSNIFGALADTLGSSSEEVVTYSISPQIHLGDATMLYARVADGYRPGGPNDALPGIPPSVDSDTVTNYEIGLKSNLLDRTLSLQVAVFDMEWDDIQLIVDFGGVSGSVNGSSARSRGVEGEVVWQPIDDLTLSLNGAYIDAELTADAFAAVGGSDGDRLPYIPEWSGSFSANYRFAVGTAEAAIGGGVRHTGERMSGFPGAGQPLGPVSLDAYTALDLNASLMFAEKWTLRAYARNVTDSIGPISRAVQGTQIGGTVVTLTPLQPRTVGLAVDFSF